MIYRMVPTVFLSALCILCSHCTNPENPYLDVESSMAIFSSVNCNDGDTITIFGKDSIGIKVYLREHIDSLTVTTTNNRFWSDTTIHSSQFTGKMLVLPLSFYNTEWQSVTLVSYRYNGDTTMQQYRLYTTSPLQPHVEIRSDNHALLSTPEVDDNVFYVWDFRGESFISNKPDTLYYFDTIPINSTCQMYVTDLNNNRSPIVFFTLEGPGNTSTGPQLVLTTPSKNDTIITAEPRITISGMITGATSVSQVTLNGISITPKTGTDGNPYFTKEFKVISDSLPTVVAVTITDTGTVISLDTFYIKYATTHPGIVLENPSIDSLVTHNEIFLIHGQVYNSRYYPTGKITYTKDSKVIPEQFDLSDGFFAFPVTLDQGRNSITLRFSETTDPDGILANKDIILYFDPSTTDTIPPAITVLYSGNVLTNNYLFRLPDPEVSILTLDNSPVSAVEINGTQAVPVSDSTRHLPTYKATLSLIHPTDTITVSATDSFGNIGTDTFRVQFNRPPDLSGDFSDIEGVVGTPLIWKPSVSDPDHDTLWITARIDGGSVITINKDSVITWLPHIADTGFHTVTVNVYDGIDQVDTSFDISVSTQSDDPRPVEWLPNSIQTPDELTSDEDTLDLILYAHTLANLRPFTYRVELQNTANEITIIYEGSDSILSWIPTVNDTGLQTIRFIITDQGNNSDTLTRIITILKATPVAVDFIKEAYAVSEAGSDVTFTLQLSKTSKSPVTVNYAVDTATTAPASDFQLPEMHTVTFSPGEDTSSITMQVFDNSTAEKDRSVVLYITGTSQNAYSGNKDTVTCTILDDDYSNYSFESGLEFGGRRHRTDTVRIPITLSQPLPQPATIKCTVADEYTDAKESDFTLPEISQSITIPAGATRDTILLLILPRSRFDLGFFSWEKKILALELSSDNASLREGDITLFKYIIGEETMFTIDDNTLSVWEGDTAIFSFRRSDTILTAVSFYFEVNDSLTTAVPGVDYRITTSNPLTFDPEYLASKQLKVIALNDNIDDGHKNVVINITEVTSGGILESSTRLEVTIFDRD